MYIETSNVICLIPYWIWIILYNVKKKYPICNYTMLSYIDQNYLNNLTLPNQHVQ